MRDKALEHERKIPTEDLAQVTGVMREEGDCLGLGEGRCGKREGFP